MTGIKHPFICKETFHYLMENILVMLSILKERIYFWPMTQTIIL